MDAPTYNRMFTLHGITMVWLFMIPSIPNVFGNFVVADHDGRQGSRVSAPQPRELLRLPRRRASSPWRRCCRAAPTPGWTFYAPYSTQHAHRRGSGRDRHLHSRALVDHDRRSTSSSPTHTMRARGLTLVPAAALRVGHLRHQHHHAPRHAGARSLDRAGGHRSRLPFGIFDPARRRRPGAVPAPLLVLLAPRRLHHDPAGDGGDQRGRLHLLAQPPASYAPSPISSLGIAFVGLLHLGPPHVRRRHERARRRRLRRALDVRRHLLGHQGLHLGGDAAQGLDRTSTRRCSTSSGSCSSSSSAA